MLDRDIRSRVDNGFTAIVPPHEIRAPRATDLQDLRVTGGLSQVMSVDDETVAGDGGRGWAARHCFLLMVS